MITIIVAGGSGTRLWPLSTPDKPKQLLSLIDDYSMIRNTYDRSTAFADEVYVVTEQSLVTELRRQIPELDDQHLIIEPGRRGTANCIVAALAHIVRYHSSDEPVAIYWSDHHIRDTKGFARAFSLAAEASSETGLVSLIGIEPTYPATVFGYIEKGEAVSELGQAFRVQRFKEKPDYQTAQEFLRSGNFLWNCGYMVATVDVYLDQFAKFAPVLKERFETLRTLEPQTEEYTRVYQDYESDTIDYAFTEKVDQLVVIAATFDWMDVGNFTDLYDSVERDEKGNYINGDNIHQIDVEGSYIRNEESAKPVAVIGLDNIVVVNTPNGILVARKDMSPRVGEIAKQL